VYLQLGRLVAQKKVAERTLAQREEMLGLTRQRVTAGLDTALELTQSEGALPDARNQIEAINEQIMLARHALAALTAQPVNALDGLSPACPARAERRRAPSGRRPAGAPSRHRGRALAGRGRGGQHPQRARRVLSRHRAQRPGGPVLSA
jgi:outer membrane protein TolC